MRQINQLYLIMKVGCLSLGFKAQFPYTLHCEQEEEDKLLLLADEEVDFL